MDKKAVWGYTEDQNIFLIIIISKKEDSHFIFITPLNAKFN